MRINSKIIRFYRSCGCLVVFLLAVYSICIHAYADSYIHGFFRYTVEDNSVTIIAYNGSEAEVVVPAMIAGKPVNVIGPDVFSENEYVKIINLPDCIMEIDETAINEKQIIQYYSISDSIDQTDNSTQEQPTSQKSEEESIVENWSDLGLVDDAGNLIAVDSEGNLVMIDQDGIEYVLDDTAEYVREFKENGDIQIVTETGEPIELKNGEEISFTDGNEDQVTINTVTGMKTVETKNEVLTYQLIEDKVAFDENKAASDVLSEQSSDVSENNTSESDDTSDINDINDIKPTSQEDSASEDDNNERHTVKVLLIIGATLLFIIVGIAIKLERSRKKNKK